MEALSRTERNNLRAITGLADANAPKENRGKWKNDPVKIAVPQNTMTRTRSPTSTPASVRVPNYAAASQFNIYTAAGKRRLTEQTFTVGNPVRSSGEKLLERKRGQSTSEPPKKRTKVGHPIQRPETETDNHYGLGARKSMPMSNEVIILSDGNDEDEVKSKVMHRRVLDWEDDDGVSTDELNFGNYHSPRHSSPTSKLMKTHKDRASHALKHPPENLTQLKLQLSVAADGKSTKELQSMAMDVDDDDPISQSSQDEAPPLRPTSPQRSTKVVTSKAFSRAIQNTVRSGVNVKERVSRFEDLSAGVVVPHIDLKRQGAIKSNMKPKTQPFLIVPSGDTLISKSFHSEPNKPSRALSSTHPLKSTNAKRKAQQKDIEFQVNGGYLGWRKLSLSTGLSLILSGKQIDLSFRMDESQTIPLKEGDVITAKCTAPETVGDNPIQMLIELLPSGFTLEALKVLFPDAFKMGEQNMIALQFSNDGDSSSYKQLLSSFPAKEGVYQIRTMPAVWDQFIEDIRQECKNRPLPVPMRRKHALSIENQIIPSSDHEDNNLAQNDMNTDDNREPFSAPLLKSRPNPISAPRRSGRKNAQDQGKVPPSADNDEVVLVYPPGTTGAVNITNGDLKRLEPEEFLNDTLIEFGLKLWIRRLEGENPNLASQIYVFSSFFYKKLNKRIIEDGFASVKKWTSRVNIFDKKYLIVPINENMHWYLAIIYHPENVLQAPEQETAIRKSVCNTRTTRPSKTAEAPSRSTTPEKTREGDEISTPEPPPDRAIETAPPSPSDASSTKPDTLALQQQEEAMMMDEEEILRHLTDCSLQSSQGEKSPKSISRPASPAQVILDNTHMEFNLMNNPGSPTASETAVQRITGVQTTEITDDNEPIIYSFSPVPSSFANCDDTADVNLIPPVPATTFYAKAPSGLKPLRASRKGKEKAVNMTSETKNIELTEDEAGADDESSFIAPPGKPKTYVFTMDSLGSSHSKVTRTLAKYLQLEAQEKLGMALESTSPAEGKQAQVPVQPNSCDCGIYLLHFAETFMKDPEGYCQKILLCPKPRPSSMAEHRIDWREDGIAGMRNELKDHIQTLSSGWKAERAAKKEAGDKANSIHVMESDDDEIIVQEGPVNKKGKRKGRR